MRLNLAITALTDYRAATLAPGDAAPLLSSTDCGCHDYTAIPDTYDVDTESPASTATWSGVIGNEDELTGDGRLIEKNALRWENLPVSFRYAPEDIGAHGGAQVVGRILTLTRGQDGAINATGDFDMGSDIGREAARQVQSGYTTGVSMDLDDVSFEIRLAADYLDRMMEGPSPLDLNDEEDDAEDDNPDKNDDGSVTVIEMKSDDEVMVTTSARIRAATLVAIPAFANANIAMDSDAEVPSEDGTEPAATPVLVAGAAPTAPPAAWFDNPGFDGPTALVIEENGRIYGHLATWGTCHTAYADRCIEPPHSGSDYAYFRTGSILTAEGTTLSVGSITMDTLHANSSLSAAQTLAHYENTGAAVAQITAGEDAYGVWVAGALSPHVTEDQVRTLRASPLSGDWRRIGGNLELQAALAVNVPGFPVPRPQGFVASGAMSSLVASGMLAPSKVLVPGTPGAFSFDDLKYLKRLIAKERTEDVETAAATATALAARVNATKVQSMARTLGLTSSMEKVM